MSTNQTNTADVETDTISTPRRQFLSKSGMLGFAVAMAPTILIPKFSMTPGVAAGTALPLPLEKCEHTLSMYNIHTGEYLKKCAFWIDGEYNPGVLKEIQYFFRDHRTNEEIKVDESLLQLLHNISEKLDTPEYIHLVSGFRSPKTNQKLRQRSCNVAQNSQHLYGKAADIVVPGRTMKQIQLVAKSLKAGGVGRYSNFVHVDTGRVRYWGAA